MSSVHDVSQGWRVCDCSCHDQPEVVRGSEEQYAPAVHNVLCCEWCDSCGERIAGDMGAHLTERHQVRRIGDG